MGYMQAVNVSAEASMMDSIGNLKRSTSYVERQGAVRSNMALPITIYDFNDDQSNNDKPVGKKLRIKCINLSATDIITPSCR